MKEFVEIQLLDGSAIEARLAVVYRGKQNSDSRLTGMITGPRREGSRTLPATVRIASVHRGDTPAAQAVLPDPCFWSPEMPFLYDVALELRQGDEVVDSTKFSIALHPHRVEKN